jgi:Tol biopolymer transport system component
MIDERDILERALKRFPAEPGMADRVYRRRHRQQRNRRIGTVVVVFALTLAAVGSLLSALRQRGTPADQPMENGRVVFVSPGQGQPTDRLYTVAADGTDLRSIADVNAEYPDWSPDGITIAFDSGAVITFRHWTTRRGHVYTVRDDGSGQVTQVTSGIGTGEFAPDWAPDGAHLAVSGVDEPGQPDGIFVVDAATGAMTPVTANPYPGHQDKEPAYSPDGTRIAFVRDRKLVEAGDGVDESALFVVDLDGRNERQLTDWVGSVGNPSWSPDGSTIVFQIGYLQGDPVSQLFTVRADGSGLHQLTSDPNAAAFWPSYSPDGARIVFTRWVFAPQPGPFRLVTIGASGGTPITLPATGDTDRNEADWGPA